MSRTVLYKGVYFGMMAAAAMALAAAIFLAHASPLIVLPACLLFLLPGRVLGYFWRDLLTGLRLLNERRYAESRRHSERFLADVRRRPWLKHLIWLGSSSYSRDPEAMALSNLGAAEIALGQFYAARIHLEDSIRVDPLNPLPHYNMGVLLREAGETEAAQTCMARARELGLTGGLTDRIVQASQRRFADTDG